MTNRDHLDRIIRSFENLSQENVGTLVDLYSANAYFKDPFNEATGQAAIIAIFEHMFRQVDDPRFLIIRSIQQENDAFIVWNFNFRIKGNPNQQCIHGSSHLRFANDQKVEYHRDYWDPAEELYEKIPVLGSLMRFLKRRARS
jgi:steroid delta-isomerase